MATLMALSVLRAIGLVGFAASVATVLTALAREAFRAIQSGRGVEAASDWANFVGAHSAGADGIFPSWMTGVASGQWAWQIAFWGIGGLLVRGAADWMLSVASQRAASGAKSELRRGLLERVLSGSSTNATGDTHDDHAASDGGLAVLASRGLDTLDDYYVKSLTAMCSSSVIPVILVLVVLWLDPVSALILVLTLPLVPLFMILIGKTTQQDTERAQSQLLRLSQHIVELSRGLPVLVGLRRDRAQARALSDMGESYRKRTMTTLRSAFQSSLALELITTISVAIVAVFIGLRLVTGSIGLDTALVVLLVAPECFQPLRDLGSAFHQSQDGVDALRRAQRVIDGASRPVTRSISSDGGVHIEQPTVGYPGREPVLVDVNLHLPKATTTVVTGPSGGGKSTLLKAMGGMLPRPEAPSPDAARPTNGAAGDPDGHGPTVSGPANTAWIGQSPAFLAATVVDEIALYAMPEHAAAWLREAEPGAEGRNESTDAESHDASVRNEGQELIRGVLVALGLAELGKVAPASLSAGQARRLAVARVLAAARRRRGEGSWGLDLLVLVDEPTAQLDEISANAVVRALTELSDSGATVVWVTHDPGTVAHADLHVEIPGDGRVVMRRCTPEAPAGKNAARGAVDAPETTGGDQPARARRPGADAGAPASPGIRRTLDLLRTLTGMGWKAAVGPILLNFLTISFGASLTALSGWLIVRASEQPGMMYLMVAIVGVRFFGLGRAVFRYVERLATHDVVLRAANRLRIRTWRSVGETALGLRSLLHGGVFLDRLVGDVDELRDETPRVLLPIATNIPVMLGAVIATWLTVPSAVWLVAGAALSSTVVIPWIVIVADRRAESVRRWSTSRTLRGVVGMMESAEDVRGNRLGAQVLSVFRGWDEAALRAARRTAFAAGLGNGATVALWWFTALMIAVLAWEPVTSGMIPAPIAAIPVLLCTALVEPAAQATEAVRAWPAFARLIAKIHGGMPEAPAPEPDGDSTDAALREARTLRLVEMSARWPGMSGPAVRGVSGGVERGTALGVTGPSGSGKSTSLAVLLGFLPAESGKILLDGRAVEPTRLRGASAWCPQDAYIFDSTLKGNLALARPKDNVPTDEELIAVLDRVGLGGYLRGQRHGLDTRVGAGGHRLSGGQRQRLAVARALLTQAPFLLLDEPTAHLDQQAATEVMEEINRATRRDADGGLGPGTIIISHRPEDLVHCANVISLH